VPGGFMVIIPSCPVRTVVWPQVVTGIGVDGRDSSPHPTAVLAMAPAEACAGPGGAY
jgi:hypothetical protein